MIFMIYDLHAFYDLRITEATRPSHSRLPGRLTRGYQAVSLEITESRNTTSPPEPKFFVRFIFPPEPDGRIRRKKLHTTHRSPQNRFFENLYKPLFPS